MNHDQIVAEIQSRAKRRGVLTHYCGSAERCYGDRGMPDLLLVGMFGAAWVEVKTAGDTLRPDQVTWKHSLKASGQIWETMDAGDLAPGHAVDMLLSFVAMGEAA